MTASTSEKADPKISMDEIATEITQIRNDVASLGRTLGAFGKDRIGSVPDLASKATAETVENARHAMTEIRKEMTSIEHDMERKVTEHPMQSLLIAAGLGFLAAYLVRR